VANEQLTAPELNKNEQIESQIHANLFFDSQAVVHKEFVTQGQTVNKQYCREILERLRKSTSCPARDCRHLNAAPQQRSLSDCHLSERIFDQKEYSSSSQPPYSPDLSQCDFFFFPKLKFHLKDRHFGTVDNIQKFVTEQLRALPHEEFQHCYREWDQCLRQCVASQENYFDVDSVDL